MKVMCCIKLESIVVITPVSLSPFLLDISNVPRVLVDEGIAAFTARVIIHRLQYDAYRNDHEKSIHSGGMNSIKTAEIRDKYEERKRKYEQLKADVSVKIQFLEENKVRAI